MKLPERDSEVVHVLEHMVADDHVERPVCQPRCLYVELEVRVVVQVRGHAGHPIPPHPQHHAVLRGKVEDLRGAKEACVILAPEREDSVPWQGLAAGAQDVLSGVLISLRVEALWAVKEGPFDKRPEAHAAAGAMACRLLWKQQHVSPVADDGALSLCGQGRFLYRLRAHF